MIVCLCHRVSDRDIRRSVADGVHNFDVLQDETQVASACYDLTKQVTLFVEGTNLNNSNYSTHGRFSNQVLDIYNYGRRYTFGARFHF